MYTVMNRVYTVMNCMLTVVNPYVCSNKQCVYHNEPCVCSYEVAAMLVVVDKVVLVSTYVLTGKQLSSIQILCLSCEFADRENQLMVSYLIIGHRGMKAEIQPCWNLGSS